TQKSGGLSAPADSSIASSSLLSNHISPPLPYHRSIESKSVVSVLATIKTCDDVHGVLIATTAPLLLPPRKVIPIDTSPFTDILSNLTITLDSQLKSGTLPTYSTGSGYWMF